MSASGEPRVGGGKKDRAPPPELDQDLRQVLIALARTPTLLVATDYDGVMAPIVKNPNEAKPIKASIRALRGLAELPRTSAAVISGRALRDLAVLSRLPAEVHLVGSHGSEFDVGFGSELNRAQRRRLVAITEQAHAIAAEYDGVTVEEKPISVAIHYRNVDPDRRKAARAAIMDGPAAMDEVELTKGKDVVELAVMDTDKGSALDRLRRQVGATAVVFVGDDVTDEKAFARLRGPDVGIKIGDGDTLASIRVADPHVAARAMTALWQLRQSWLFGENAVPIERLSLLANGRNHAVLTPAARVAWQCFPRVDSAAIFADLVGGDSAGHFSVAPGDPDAALLGQRYVGDSMVLETRFADMTVIDYLAADTPVERTDLLRVVTGTGAARIEFAPRPEFGQGATRIQRQGDGLRVFGTNAAIVLRSPGVTWELEADVQHTTAVATYDLDSGPLVLELRCGTDDLGPHPDTEPDRRAAASRPWSDWAAGLCLPSVVPDLVTRSALILKALQHKDTGAILSAPTTSLPGTIGGVRNWDYRYCWIRTAAVTATTLLELGSTTEAEAFVGWLRKVVGRASGPEWLHPLYTFAGRDLSPEAVIESLSGYAGSRPVRIGNAANSQLQLDVFGPVAEMLYRLAETRGSLTEPEIELQRAMVEAVRKRWREPDHGIWELRAEPKHRVYTKVQGWVALDAGLRTAELLGLAVPAEWTTLREEIRDDVLTHGWDEEVGRFTATYGEDDLDASVLTVGLSGLLDPMDPRFVATVAEVERQLRKGATVYRYLTDDGLPGQEGGFHICTTWLVEAMVLTGRPGQARELFDAFLDTVGPTGLLSEQYDPVAEQSLGNHPEAYSHLGLIRCAQLFGRISAGPLTRSR